MGPARTGRLIGTACGVAVALLAAMAPAAHATTITETFTIPSTATNWSNQSLTFAGLDALAPAGSTLNAVIIEVTESLSASASIRNSKSAPETAAIQVQNTGTLVTPFGTITVNDAATSSTLTLSGKSRGRVSVTGSASASGTYTSGLSGFLSPWSATAGDTGLVTLLAQSNAVKMTSSTDLGGVSVLVTYDYTAPAVPEPASLTLFGVSLLGLGFVRLRRG